MNEKLVALVEIPQEQIDVTPPDKRSMLERKVSWAMGDAVAQHLLANQGRAIAYRLTVNEEERPDRFGLWGRVTAYRLHLDILHYSYQLQVMPKWNNDWTAMVTSDEYVPLWHTLPKSALPPETRIVKVDVVRWRHTTRGKSTGSLLRELGRRYRRFLIRCRRPVSPPDRSRQEQAILDWGQS